MGVSPAPALQSSAGVSYSSVVSHRIAPDEFLSGGFYVQAPVQFHPPRRALLRKAQLWRDSFGWPDAVVQLLFGSRF